MAPPPVYYINMDARPDRRAFMEAQFTRLALDAQRVRGITPPELTDDELALYSDPYKAHFLSPQQVCCTMGHRRAWAAFLESGAEYGLIFEDDAVLSERLPDFLDKLPQVSEDLIRIENSARPHLTSDLLPLDVAGIGFRMFRSTGWGAAGYIIRRGAALTLSSSPRLFDLPTDAALFCPLELPARDLRLLQADPALCIQLKERPVSAEARSNITSFIFAKSWRGWWTAQERRLRWGWIKSVEKFTRPDWQRRVIPFADDLPQRQSL